MKTVFAIAAAILGITFQAESIAARDNIQTVQNLSVIDGKGKRVGNVVGFFQTNSGGETGGAATVALRVGSEAVILYVRPTGFVGMNEGFTKTGGTLYFESASCTGQPYQNSQDLLPSLAGPHVLNGTKLYAFEGVSRSIIVRSVLERSGCRPIDPEQAVAQPLRFLADLSEEFVPPFTLRAQ